MKKKEVIYYSGFSMVPPVYVELLENKKGRILSHIDERIVDLQEHKILTFWDKIEELGVWKWHKKYPYWTPKYQPLTCGRDWKLKLRDKKGRAIYCSGYESFPRKFKYLIKEMNILFDEKVDF